MKTVILAAVFAVLFTSCAEKQHAAKPVKTSNAATIAKADEAFRELDAETAPQTKKSEQPKLQTENNEQTSLYQDKPRPSETAEKAKPSTNAEYPFKNGYPIWVIDPASSGCAIPAVGSAKVQQGGFYAQKRAAEMQARAELARMVKLQVDNEIATERYVRTKERTQNAESSVEIYSRQRSNELLSSVKEAANWLDKKTGDYYVLLCSEK